MPLYLNYTTTFFNELGKNKSFPTLSKNIYQKLVKSPIFCQEQVGKILNQDFQIILKVSNKKCVKDFNLFISLLNKLLILTFFKNQIWYNILLKGNNKIKKDAYI